jgi:ubiquitin thioesterase OTU1
MNFRCRTLKGTEHIRLIDKNLTLGEFRQILSEKTGIPVGAQKILRGYPPTPVTSQDSELIGNIFQDGDTLTILQESNPQTTGKLLNDENIKAKHVELDKVTDSTDSILKEVQHDRTETRAIQEPSKICAEDGVMVKRTIPDDNSCLFNAVAYVLDRNINAQNLRNVVAEVVLQDPETYSEAVLGRPPQQYAEWITHKDHWGGAVELAILSKYYKSEIVAFDVANLRPHCFGEGRGYKQRVFLVYDGIHYDALAFAPSPDASPELDVTIFSPNDELAFGLCYELVLRLNKEHKYTDTSNFEVLCQECHAVLIGEKGIQTHAHATGHTQFVERLTK